ncbi:hypothetical protein RB195_022496 [Necator americanus]|uniref:SAND domain-containing protein n=1 Tax=Necator americanus TaxID=51031 RepID=A0ABR1EG62_NECAM
MKRQSFEVLAAETSTEEGTTNMYGKIIQVICGSLVAKMHIELFLCPGIHQSCIEYEGEMISPKEFTVRANKDKQKDWKGSIRIGKSNLRSLMEMRSFDFYNHSQFCSAKCQSRNYITHKEKEGDKDRRNNIQAEKATAQISQLCNSRILNSYNLDAASISHLIQLGRVLRNRNENSTNNNYIQFTNDNNFSSLPLSPFNANLHACTEEIVDVDDSLVTFDSATTPTTEQILLLMLTGNDVKCPSETKAHDFLRT